MSPMCSTCICDAHRYHPLHWIEEWNGNFFERRDLSELGLIIHLGHRGTPCPQRPSRDASVKFCIVDLNGVHECRVHYCYCVDALSQVSQLVRADLLPATLDRIETAFTVDTLKAFHVLFDIAKITNEDFVWWIRRRTDNKDMQRVRVCFSLSSDHSYSSLT